MVNAPLWKSSNFIWIRFSLFVCLIKYLVLSCTFRRLGFNTFLLVPRYCRWRGVRIDNASPYSITPAPPYRIFIKLSLSELSATISNLIKCGTFSHSAHWHSYVVRELGSGTLWYLAIKISSIKTTTNDTYQSFIV